MDRVVLWRDSASDVPSAGTRSAETRRDMQEDLFCSHLFRRSALSEAEKLWERNCVDKNTSRQWRLRSLLIASRPVFCVPLPHAFRTSFVSEFAMDFCTYEYLEADMTLAGLRLSIARMRWNRALCAAWCKAAVEERGFESILPSVFFFWRDAAFWERSCRHYCTGTRL